MGHASSALEATVLHAGKNRARAPIASGYPKYVYASSTTAPKRTISNTSCIDCLGARCMPVNSLCRRNPICEKLLPLRHRRLPPAECAFHLELSSALKDVLNTERFEDPAVNLFFSIGRHFLIVRFASRLISRLFSYSGSGAEPTIESPLFQSRRAWMECRDWQRPDQGFRSLPERTCRTKNRERGEEVGQLLSSVIMTRLRV